MRHEVTTNDSLESIGNRYQLARLITRVPGVVLITQKTMSTTFEAIARAAYEYGGMDAAKKVVEKVCASFTIRTGLVCTCCLESGERGYCRWLMTEVLA